MYCSKALNIKYGIAPFITAIYDIHNAKEAIFNIKLNLSNCFKKFLLIVFIG